MGDAAPGVDLPLVDLPFVDIPGFDLGATDLGEPASDVVTVVDTGPSCGVATGPAGIMEGCYTENDCSPVCPTAHVANSLTVPNFRVTSIQITSPATLASSIITNALDGFIASRTFLWGMSFNFDLGVFRTGPFNPLAIVAGPPSLGHMGDGYAYFAGNAPTTGGASATRWDTATGAVTLAGSTATVSTPLADLVRLPIFGAADSETEVFELPLNHLIVHGVQIDADRGCIGVARTDATTGFFFNECSGSAWYTTNPTTLAPYGVFEGDISVTDAASVTITAFPGAPDLCSVISGEYSLGATCASVAQALWPTQPTTLVGTTPAFHLVADFTAIAANLGGVIAPTDAGTADSGTGAGSTAGDPCTTDAMCDNPALACDDTLSFGECTGNCTDSTSQIAEAAECGGAGSTCVTEGDGVEAVSDCWHACTATALSVATGACSPGFACTGWWYTHAEGVPDVSGCVPYCSSDAQCPTGLHCNARALGECLATAPGTTARADGQPCDPTVTVMVPGETSPRNVQCQGICFSVDTNAHDGICGSTINIRVTTACPNNPAMAPLSVTGDNLGLCVFAPCTTSANCTAPLTCTSTSGGSECEYPATDGGTG